MIVAAPLLLVALLAVSPDPARDLTAVAGSGPAFALTFDAHAEMQGASDLLALLRERHIRATIFVTGSFAERFPELLRLARRDGHEIGNHTFSHPHLTAWAQRGRHTTLPGVTRETVQDELLRAARAIAAATGSPPALLWRAPYGEENREIRGWAAELGYLHVGWTHGGRDALDALDWVEDPRQRRYLGPEAMARRLLSFERRTGVPLAGSIVLMHLGSGRPDHPLLEALPIFLDETDRRGLKPLPVGSLLLRAGNTVPEAPASAP